MMNAQQRKRLYYLILLLIGTFFAAFLILNALKENINLFFTPTEVKTGKVPKGALIRVGGMVTENSVVRGKALAVTFTITDYTSTLPISYNGILPDLFKEGKGIVVLGRMDGDIFTASEVLAKHDENYMPSEVRSLLKNSKLKKEDHNPHNSSLQNSNLHNSNLHIFKDTE